MTLSPYVLDYTGRFRFSCEPELVWSAMEQFDQYESWWSWLGSLNIEGRGLRAGSVLVGTVSPPLPYRMRIRVQIDESVPARLIDATVKGDLEGPARLSMHRDEKGTLVEVRWTLEMKQRRMRVAARIAYPLLRRGHDMVVEATVRSFRSKLSCIRERAGA